MTHALVATLFVLGALHAAAQELAGPAIRMQADAVTRRVVISLKVDGTWQQALAASSAVHVRSNGQMRVCALTSAVAEAGGFTLRGDCGIGAFEQHLHLTAESDVIDVSTRFDVKEGTEVNSVEDRWDFLPERHEHVDEHTGPLDFVWSQDIKAEAGDLVPTNSFKSPAVMMQQGRIFAALVPELNTHHAEVRAMDLDVTSDAHPWMACGAIPSEPHGHSYFRRSAQTLRPIAGAVVYRYDLVVSDQPAKLGYRRVVRRLWAQFGHPALLRSADEQQNPLRPELSSFDDWRNEAWHAYAGRIYKGFECGGRRCGTLQSNRDYLGHWDPHSEADAWFNAWFQTLRTAYGWYVYARAAHDAERMAEAESVLNLALASPQKQGAFPTIYLVDSKRWTPGDGWAGYADSYHAFSMSWTAYWMLRWAEDLVPSRKAEILGFVRPYGDFLLRNQQTSGVIPSWYNAATLEPRSEFRDFNAETAPSALLLAALGTATGDSRYTAAAERAMAFVEREVLPRQRWWDFETYLSCARKDYGFFDRWTAQYPQNNLAEIQAPEAMLALYRATGKPEYLERGTEMLDYLLLTQQVWNNPLFTPKLLGGFTTQNTDQEWSDARQGYAAMVLADYYDATGTFEYLERAVAASRSTFAVAPWENWAHVGYGDGPGALTGFHWGTGSAMTTVEILAPRLGDALIDAKAGAGVGFDECTVDEVAIEGASIRFRIASPARERTFLVRFRNLDAGRAYSVRWNDGAARTVKGDELMRDGLRVGPLR